MFPTKYPINVSVRITSARRNADSECLARAHRSHSGRFLPLTVDEEELDEMQDDEERVESVQVHVEGIAPLHVVVSALALHQVLVSDEPEERNAVPSQQQTRCSHPSTARHLLAPRGRREVSPWPGDLGVSDINHARV